MRKLKALYQKYREPILYLIFGVLTTVVNYVVYFPCSQLGLDWTLSTVLAWVAAVLFAYITNRIWVFESKVRGLRSITLEFLKFVFFRVASLGLDLLAMWICMDLAHMGRLLLPDITLFGKVFEDLPLGEFLARTISQVVVVVSNYIFSKLFIFRKHDTEN